MKIGERLARALERAGKSQREVALRAKMEEGTLSKIITGKTESPFFSTIEKIVRAADLTWGELFEEPQMRLSEGDARVAREFRQVLDRVIENDTKQKRRDPGHSIIRDAPRREYDDVVDLPAEEIPEGYQRVNANRVYRVQTDAMGILEGSLIFARATQNLDSADGETVVCRLNGKLYLRRLDRRGGKTILEAANPRYPAIHIKEDDQFALVAITLV
ncbi:MAG TPA: S24 family peptidase [Thermoanaerobaculia bacterium]|jgi:DNA polymerase V|nr:S24 family peptidase [Thermoanaerobaculia bacterium]